MVGQIEVLQQKIEWLRQTCGLGQFFARDLRAIGLFDQNFIYAVTPPFDLGDGAKRKFQSVQLIGIIFHYQRSQFHSFSPSMPEAG